MNDQKKMLVLEIINIFIICYLGSLYDLLLPLFVVIRSNKLCVFYTFVHTLLTKEKLNNCFEDGG